MKYAVISTPHSRNIGDEVQSFAARELLQSETHYLDRERLDNPNIKGKVKLICNGWFLDSPNNWPPADNIMPLFISFHATTTNSSKRLLFKEGLIEYYRKFEPIGCRDNGTLKFFKNIGIDAYLSSCITLTLENKEPKRDGSIVLADPLRYNYMKPYRDFIIEQMVPHKFKKDIKIITQRRPHANVSEEQRFKDAEELIKLYSRAKLVITSRIHAALPCLALKTPVLFINAGYHSKVNLIDRFEGILDLFHVINEDYFPYSSYSIKHRIIRGLGLYKNSKIKPLPINWDKPEPNSDKYLEYAKLIKKKVSEFINNSSLNRDVHK